MSELIGRPSSLPESVVSYHDGVSSSLPKGEPKSFGEPPTQTRTTSLTEIPMGHMSLARRRQANYGRFIRRG